MYKVLLAALLAVAATTASARPSEDFTVKFTRRQNGNYPPALQTPPQSSLPQAWIDALNAATAAGKIPNVPVSTLVNGNPTYPNNVGTNTDTCNWTLSKCLGAKDISSVPNNEWTISFDDGPTQASPALYDYLHSHSQAGTHFMIGSQILVFQDAFKHAMQTGQQAAVHTWSHTLMSSKTNMELLGELGWNMQIIYDLSGRVPTLWRPPQGDVDNRVRAVAENVFNLTTVMWDAECNDWCIQADGSTGCPGQTPGGTQDSVRAAIQNALHGSQTPGVTLLEHELNTNTVGFFEEYYPSLTGLGWKPQAVSDHFGWNWYANAVNNDDTPINVTSIDTVTVAAALAKNSTSAVSVTVTTSPSSTSELPSSSTGGASSATMSSSAGQASSVAGSVHSNSSSRGVSLSLFSALFAFSLAALMATVL